MHAAPDEMHLTVDGETFRVIYDVSQPGTYHFTWLTGPNPGYGFTSGMSTQTRRSEQMLIDSIRDFLGQIDPETGYIEDD